MVFVLVVAASVVTLLGVVGAVVEAHRVEGIETAVLITSALLTIAISWSLVHTTFAMRYADLYYRDPDGGVRFEQDEDPDFRDFAYLAFTVGMTYQVSDTELTDRSIRRTVLVHALVSFVFGTAIIALAINLVAGLVN